MKEELREYFDMIIENIDTFEPYMKSAWLKKQVSKNRNWVTKDRKNPSVADLYNLFFSRPMQLQEIIHFLQRPVVNSF